MFGSSINKKKDRKKTAAVLGLLGGSVLICLCRQAKLLVDDALIIVANSNNYYVEFDPDTSSLHNQEEACPPSTSIQQPQTLEASNFLFYDHEPALFANNLTDCILHQNCSMLYWHVQKTGGTYFASRLYSSMNIIPVNHTTINKTTASNDNRTTTSRAAGIKEAYQSKEWCCHESFMQKSFRPRQDYFCGKRLGVYEVKPHHFQEVIHSCTMSTSATNRSVMFASQKNPSTPTRILMKNNDNESTSGDLLPPSTKPQQKNVVVLLSVREPIQRTLSAIHQRCNVRSERLSEESRQICERCSYGYNGSSTTSAADADFFDTFVMDTNRIFEGMRDMLLQEGASAAAPPFYVVDASSWSRLFASIEHRVGTFLYARNITPSEEYHFEPGRVNPERDDKLCDFGMPSVMMKKLKPSLDIYHQLWASGL